MTGHQFCTTQNLLTPEKKRDFCMEVFNVFNKTLRMFEVILKRDLGCACFWMLYDESCSNCFCMHFGNPIHG